MSVDKNFSSTMIESMGELIDKLMNDAAQLRTEHEQKQLNQQLQIDQQQQRINQQQEQISWLTSQLQTQQTQNTVMLELIRALRTSITNLQHSNP